MSTNQNKAIVRRYLKEVVEGGHVELLESYYAIDGSAANGWSREHWREAIVWHHKVASGFKVTILDMMAEGDKVMVHWQVDITFSSKYASEYTPPFVPPDQPVQWRNVHIWRIVDGKIVTEQRALGWTDMLVDIGAIPLKQIEHNKAAVRKFVDGLNRQEPALLAEVCIPEVAKEWSEALPSMYASMKDHHIELTDIVADGDGVAVKMATSGYHTGELFGLPASGKWWTNRVYTFFHFTGGKICEVDALADVENHLKQIGGVIVQTSGH